MTQKRLKNDSNIASGLTFESLWGHFGVGLPESLFLANLFLIKLERISGFSSLFLAHFARVLKHCDR